MAVVLCSTSKAPSSSISSRRWNVPLDALRDLNIDAMTRWKLDGLPVDGLQRLLLYDRTMRRHGPFWLSDYSYSCSHVMQPRERSSLFAGFCERGLLMSSFLAVMIGLVAGIFHATRLAWRRYLESRRALRRGGLSSTRLRAVDLVLLQYIDTSGGKLVYLRPESGGRRSAPEAIILSFGPMLAGAAAELLLAAPGARGGSLPSR